MHTPEQRRQATRRFATWGWNRADYDVTWSVLTNDCAVLIRRKEHRAAAAAERGRAPKEP